MEHLKASTSPIPYSGEGWFDPLEEAVRFQVRAFIEAMVEAELLAALGGRDRYERKGAPKGYRNGHATGIGSLSGPSVNRGFRCRAPG